MPAERDVIVVVSSEGVHCRHTETDATYTIGSLPELGALAQAFGAQQVWLHASALPAAGLPPTLARQRGEPPPDLRHRWLEVTGSGWAASSSVLRPWLSAWAPLIRNSRVEVSVPAWEPNSPWAHLEPDALLWGLCDFYEATGALWHASGGYTSDLWLREHFGAARTAKLAPTARPPLGEGKTEEPDIWWTLEPGRAGTRFARCFAYDVNAMYLGGASSTTMGAGELQRLEGVPLSFCQAEGWPGYWWVPDQWTTAEEGLPLNRPGYVASPTARMLCDLAAGAAESETSAWVWTGSHRPLEWWYKRLRDARAALSTDPVDQLSQSRAAALSAVKAVYTEGIGRLGSSRRGGKEGARSPDDPLWQPYWRDAVRAEARARLLRRIMGTRPDAGQLVAVIRDCVYYLTSSRNPDTFAATLGLPLSTKVGQFKVHGVAEGALARLALRSETPGSDLEKLMRDG